MEIDRWDCSMVFCIKPYKTLKVGNGYSVMGSGDLEYNNADGVEGRTGYGLCVEDSNYAYNMGIIESWKLPHSEQIKHYYFTLDELNEYFISNHEELLIRERDERLNQILD